MVLWIGLQDTKCMLDAHPCRTMFMVEPFFLHGYRRSRSSLFVMCKYLSNDSPDHRQCRRELQAMRKDLCSNQTWQIVPPCGTVHCSLGDSYHIVNLTHLCWRLWSSNCYHTLLVITWTFFFIEMWWSTTITMSLGALTTMWLSSIAPMQLESHACFEIL